MWAKDIATSLPNTSRDEEAYEVFVQTGFQWEGSAKRTLAASAFSMLKCTPVFKKQTQDTSRFSIVGIPLIFFQCCVPNSLHSTKTSSTSAFVHFHLLPEDVIDSSSLPEGCPSFLPSSCSCVAHLEINFKQISKVKAIDRYYQWYHELFLLVSLLNAV